jgi:hypothetical protein
LYLKLPVDTESWLIQIYNTSSQICKNIKRIITPSPIHFYNHLVF